MVLSIDFETRSTVNLPASGVYPYAQHPTTDIWCMAWAFDDEEPQIWHPGLDIPRRVAEYVERDGELRAWNAQFERIIWREILSPVYGFPTPRLTQWHDTAAEAAAMALPRHLFSCAMALGVDAQKDMQGHNLMMRMCRPRSEKNGQLVWWTDPERLERLYEYCKQDVRVERDIYHRVRRLSTQERRVYVIDQMINDRGVLIDYELVDAAQRIVSRGLEEVNGAIERLTGGEVTAVTEVEKLQRWLNYRGVDVDNLQKSTVRDLLEEDHDSDIKRVLELRSEGARTSTSKIKSMYAARCADDRVRGLLLYHGASTGRWSGKLVQPQNFPRGEIENIEDFIPLVLAGDYEAIDAQHPPLIVISSMLRSMLISKPGHVLMSGDYNAIEARVLAWLAGHSSLVSAFANDDPVYEQMAASVFHVPLDAVTPEQRQIGKALVLGCGFGMGGKKFQGTLYEKLGIAIARAKADEYVQTYRAVNRPIKDFWYDLERAAVSAVREPGATFNAGRIAYRVGGSYLWCKLPSGRLLCYSRPRLDVKETPWGEERQQVSFMGQNTYTNKWTRMFLYGGWQAENVTQATARDIMAASIVRLEREGYPVLMTVHDEIVSEAEESRELDGFVKTMTRKPRWADGCPIKVEGWKGTRYRK